MPNEPQRQQALRRYRVLDTPPEEAFDRITLLASQVLEAPIAFITLADEDRLWFKSFCGFPAKQIDRNLSFCGHAIEQDELLVVEDATQDARFAHFPIVVGSPHVRFYAGAPLRTPDGFRLGTLCVVDIVPRHLSPEARAILQNLSGLVVDALEGRLIKHERTRQMAAILELHSGILITDPTQPDNPIVFANPGFAKLTGYPVEEVVGKNARFLQGPQTDQVTSARIKQAVKDGRSFHEVLLNYHKDGTPFWNEMKVGAVHDEQGQLISYVGVQNDVTERENITKQLQQSFAKLGELESLRDNLTGMIIHDLRSPLLAVSGCLDFLRPRVADRLAPKELQFLEMANRGASTLHEMITSLLDVARMETGAMPTDLQPVDLRLVVQTALEPFAAIIGDRTIRREFQDGVPPAKCDFDLTVRVVSNLLNNALKYTSNQGTVIISLTQEADQVRLAVADDGPGVPAAYHARIFEKFGQVEGQRQRHSTGLGLTFCKLAINAQCGVIGLESAEGEGATFYFKLPVAHPPLA